MPKLRLPQIEKVSLRRFSLFTANPNAEFTCDEGVLCLVGANGIGKSTLLSAINFCLTGIVSDPTRQFDSMEEYYRYSRAFSEKYFRGRIDPNDEDDAEITIVFNLGSFIYTVRRGMFEPDELRTFSIINRDNEAVDLSTDDMPRGERHQKFVERFVQDSGLSSFEEFVFLQHFVFTFDEQRKTLLYNQRILDRALYRAFGMEPDMAKRADTISREIEQADSRVRNAQWEATKTRKRINAIISSAQAASGAQEKYDSLAGDHESLTRQFEEESKILREIEDTIKDTNLRLAEFSMKETSLRDEYAKYFDHRFNYRPPIAKHPIITQSIEEHTCSLCGNKEDAAIESIVAKTTADSCPLCDSSLNTETAPISDDNHLKEIDDELAQCKINLNGVLKRLMGLRNEETEARKKFNATKEKLEDFDRQNSATLEGLRQVLKRNTTSATLNDYRDQLATIETEKKTAFERREALKSQRLELQKKLEQEYLKAEKVFLPRFKELAERFLGMELMVQLDVREPGLNLYVTVRGITRRQQQQLSESQRFFLDIALRMALTEHMSDATSRGGMFIDTPEGSLDIAYEKRAGEMLALFAKGGHRIVMTANLNSSQLLLALAHRCRQEGMKLCKMTDWAELSEVQKDEGALFDVAYSKIIKAMGTSAQ